MNKILTIAWMGKIILRARSEGLGPTEVTMVLRLDNKHRDGVPPSR